MTEAKDIDAIEDIVDMVQTMASLGVSSKGLRTLDEMKTRVKETLQMSEKKKSSWTAKEAFSVLTEVKEDDERKRATLHKFYEDTEVCFNTMDDKVRTLLEQNIGNLSEKIAINKRNLKQKDYIVLVAGETSSGKSTLLNLILGEQLLPYSILSTTSTICELKYGKMSKLVAHFKDKDPETGETKKTVRLGQSMETSQQSYLHEISSFVHVKTNREKGSDYKKIELFWPHSLLKQGIVIVDSPGVGESTIMDDMVKEYLPEAFTFIYVINSVNAGGIQKDRVEKLIEHARKVSLEQQRESSSTCALFVCNKWDQVPPDEAKEVKNYIIKKLTQCWPNLDPDSQIIYMSSTNALKAQGLGVITDEFAGLMNGIKSMVLKSIEARLQTQWRWLDYLLSRMAYHTKAFIHNSHKDRSKVIDRMMFITERLVMIQKEQSSVNVELQEYLENKTDNAVSALSKYLKSNDVVEQFTSWTLDDVPDTEERWEVTRSYIQKALTKRLQDVIAAWEEEHHVFADSRTSLIQYFQQRFNFVEGQLRNLESSVVADDAASPASGPLGTESFTVAERVIIGVTSPIWFPVGLVVLVVSVPVVGAMAVKERVQDWSKTREYEKDKRGFMAKASKEYLTEAAEEQNLRSYVVEQLKESQVCLKQVVARIPELIEADKLLCQQLRDENRSQKEIEDFYKPLYGRSLQLRERMALFGIKEVRTMDISCSDLEWNHDGSSLLGTGAFADVYRGKLKQTDGEKPAALKVWKEELNESNASVFLAETEILRKLNYPFIVKFYGAALLKEGDQLRAILVMELCKENLMRHIFSNRNNIPGVLSSTPPTERNTIRWAKDIANALEIVHRQGFVHRDLKLENILAFSVLTGAKEDDERKRETLHQLYEDTEVCLNSMDDKVRSILEKDFGKLKDEIALNKWNLKQKDYIVLVAGETSSGKSTLLNLILGEKLLPYSHLCTTSTICELKYGTTPKLVVHFKDKDPETGDSEKTVWLGQSMETSHQRYLDEISSFVHVKTNRAKGSDYQKIELFWPHSLLQQGIVIVDSPGIGESSIMDEVVKKYLPEAFAFIYVINTANAGGIQKDRVEKLIEQARNVSLDQRKESSATRALFVCNKWDQVPPEEANVVKKNVIEKLTQYLPSMNPDSQIIYMSSTNALRAQSLGVITDEFAGLMNGIKSMVLKSIEARLQTQWRWLHYLLSRMAYQTNAFILNCDEDREKVIKRMTFIIHRLSVMKDQQSSVNKELQEHLDKKTDNAVSALSKYLTSTDVVEQFSSWTLDDVPNTEEGWEVAETCIQEALIKRLHNVIAAWEEEHHVFADARTSLIEYFQQRFSFVEEQLRNLQSFVLVEDAASAIEEFEIIDHVTIIDDVTSPIWVPIGLVGLIVSVPVVVAMAAKATLEDFGKIRVYENDKCGFMAQASKEFLTEAVEDQNLRLYVLEQLKECHVCLNQIVSRIPELIEADEMLCQQLVDETRSNEEILDFYRPLYQKSLKLRGRMAMFGIKDVRTMDISCSDLEWKGDESSLLGRGAFASVYRGKLKLREREKPVALKVWKEELNDSNASAFLAGTEKWRKLNNPFIVQFYGGALLKEGDQVRAILVMELCKENLMRHIFLNPENIPAVPSSTPPTYKNTIRWAKEIANALEFIHSRRIVHRDLKLENILITHEGVAKISDVSINKQTSMITGTMTGTPACVAPEVIRSNVYDSKADIYSFGIMMWEMWYGKRALLDVGGDLNTFLKKVADGVRPCHVEDMIKPPDGWQHLMQSCWDGEADKRPTAAMCHKALSKVYKDIVPFI